MPWYWKLGSLGLGYLGVPGHFRFCMVPDILGGQHQICTETRCCDWFICNHLQSVSYIYEHYEQEFQCILALVWFGRVLVCGLSSLSIGRINLPIAAIICFRVLESLLKQKAEVCMIVCILWTMNSNALKLAANWRAECSAFLIPSSCCFEAVSILHGSSNLFLFKTAVQSLFHYLQLQLLLDGRERDEVYSLVLHNFKHW